MPLEVHDYLVSQGWGGKGTGLRQGAISRPLAIPQKKNLAGLGKDRDEAFPFWDHLFSAAAKSIQLKCTSDDEKEDDNETTTTGVSLRKTKTGIFSTRRPVDGTPADSGSSTPNETDADSSTPRLSLMALAKRDAAKRRLYAQFFRGPVLGPEVIAEEERRLAKLVQEAFDKQNPGVESITITEHIEVKMADENVVIDLEVSKSSSKKKRKGKSTDEEPSSDGEDEEARKERKRRRKEEKRKKEEKEAAKLERRKEKKEKKEKKATTESVDQDQVASSSKNTEHNKSEDSKSERRRRKEEKKKLKSLRLQEKTAEEDGSASEETIPVETPQLPSSRKEKTTRRSKTECAEEDEVAQLDDRKRKKKRKREDNPDDSS